jgi:hypothetical protein
MRETRLLMEMSITVEVRDRGVVQRDLERVFAYFATITAAFAMGSAGIAFVERTPGREGYMIDSSARVTSTSGFERYVLRV